MPSEDRPPFRKNPRFRKSRPPGKRRGPPDASEAAGVRLQKVMSSAGVGSRRHCEELIEAGRVQIDGQTAKLGDRVEPGKQTVRVDGETLRLRSAPVYFLVNKPEGVVSTNYDQDGRTRVIDLVPHDDREHLFTVGRLDLSSEGLILVTNDGELANQLTHPRYGVEKTYLALVAGRPEPDVLQKLRHGVHLAEGVARCVSVYVKKELPQSTLLEIVLNEGKNREIRRILAKVGHKVLTLKRTAIGDVSMRGLKPGEFRPPTFAELKALREAMFKKRKPRQARPVEESELTAKPRDAEAGGDDEGATQHERPQHERPQHDRPQHDRPQRGGRFQRDGGRDEGRGGGKPFGKRPAGKPYGKPDGERPAYGKPAYGKPAGRPAFGKTPDGKFAKKGPRFGKPRPERTVLGGGDNEGRPPRGKRRFERGGARPAGRPRFGDQTQGDQNQGEQNQGRPPAGAQGRPPRGGRQFSERPPFPPKPRDKAREADEEFLGSHPKAAKGSGGRKEARKRRPTPLFPKRKKRGKPPEPGFGTVIE